jgi:hypothetical protein
MKTQMAGLLVTAAMVAGLAAGLSLGSGGLAAQEAESGNYFDTQTVAAGVRWGQDPNDPYAPVDLGGTAIASGDVSNSRAAGQAEATESEWAVPPMPGRPGRPY